MDIESVSKEKLQKLSNQVGSKLEIRKIWPDEYNPGFYLRFHGVIHKSPMLTIEIAGSYYFGFRDGKEIEEIDIFPFVNSERVSPCNTEKYLWCSQSGLRWDHVEMGYDGKYALKALLLE